VRIVRDKVELFGEEQQVAVALEVQRPRARVGFNEVDGSRRAWITHVDHTRTAPRERMAYKSKALIGHDLHAIRTTTKLGVTEPGDVTRGLRNEMARYTMRSRRH
jgi:hypothetical protein